jgi:drug/metabolite transporter (DMT)-like permease
MLPDDPIKAIALAVSATVLFGSSDTISKYLSGSLPIVEFIWIRYVLFLITAACLVRRRSILPRNRRLQITRGLCVVGSSILFVYGVRQMTMAQATTISFLSPLLITILSIPLLGETVGPRRWAAVAVGMLGMLVVVRPGLGGFQPAALFGVASAFCWAMALIITRKISSSDTPQTTVLWSAGIGTAVLSLILPFQAIWPTPKQLGLSLVLGVLASGGQWVVILAHRSVAARPVLLQPTALGIRAGFPGVRQSARHLDDGRRRHHCRERPLHGASRARPPPTAAPRDPWPMIAVLSVAKASPEV